MTLQATPISHGAMGGDHVVMPVGLAYDGLISLDLYPLQDLSISSLSLLADLLSLLLLCSHGIISVAII